MHKYILSLLFLGATGAAWGQNVSFEDRPKLLVPKKAPTPKDIAQRDAQYLYVQGLAAEREERFAEALKAFEEAARLDPDAPAIFKAQLQILIGVGRYADAQTACTKIVTLDPTDFQTWYIKAKLHRSAAQYPAAITALETGLKTEGIKEFPEIAQQFHIDLGGLYEGNDKFGPAADALNKAAAILEHPDHIADKVHVPREAVLARSSEIYEKIGQLYRKAKRYDDSVAALRKAQERSPERAARLNFLLAQVCDEQGNLKQALTFVDAYLQTQPLSNDPHELKISLLRRLKQTDAIVPWLEEAARRERFNNNLQRLLAREYANAKLTKKAEAAYEKIAEDSPSPEVYRGLFQLYKVEGTPGMTRILTMLDKVMDKTAREEGPTPIGTVQHARAMVGALRADSELAQKLVETASQQKKQADELKFDTVFFLAMLADQHRKNLEAERLYRQCLATNTIPANEAVLYSGLLRVLGNARKHEEMVTVCQEGLAKSKSSIPLLFLKELARAQAALKRYDDALQTADRAVKESNDESRLLFQILRIRILTMAERFETAETDCTALIKANERPAETVELRYLLSNLYAAMKQHVKSEEQLQLILKIDPDNATVNNDLGYLWADKGKNLTDAEAMIRKALDIDRSQRRRNPSYNPEDDKDNAAFVDSLGWVLFRRGQIDEARKELERATTLGEGDDPVIYDHLGDVYLRLKMRPEASRAWQRSLELYDHGIRGKDDERVRDIRRKIERAKEEIGGR